MCRTPEPKNPVKYLVTGFVLMVLIIGAYAYDDSPPALPEPATYLNFNEGSGVYALDVSGNGNAGTIHGASRIDGGGCGRAIYFNGINNYVEIPFTLKNHPDNEISISTWFFTDTFEPQVLVSSYRDGGFRLGIGDGRDLWWTIRTESAGEVSVPVQHEGISLNEWHYVTGTYDGKTSKIYLDGILRNQMNATGNIYYTYDNYVMLGAEAGTYNIPDQNCPNYFRGGLDEVRIYDRALKYGQVMDERYRCSQEPSPPQYYIAVRTPPPSFKVISGSVKLNPVDSVIRILTFDNKTVPGVWTVGMQPGSSLRVKAVDLYSKAYPDAWYVEIADERGRVDRGIAFPNTNNAPVEGAIPSGNATVLIRYFDGKERFPATVAVQFDSIAPPPEPIIPPGILSNPIIVIYSASWATLVALVLVILWLHKRKKKEDSG